MATEAAKAPSEPGGTCLDPQGRRAVAERETPPGNVYKEIIGAKEVRTQYWLAHIRQKELVSNVEARKTAE